MKFKKSIRTILIWLPSIMTAMIFIQNAMGKLLQADQQDKIISNNTVIIIVGITLLVSTALFLFNKTIIWGTTLLSFYMVFIAFIHLYKGKPFEVVVLIIATTILAAYLRKPGLFHLKKIQKNVIPSN